MRRPQGDTICVLFQDISRAPMSEKDREIMTLISYLGCGISSIFLGITLMTYLIFGWVHCNANSSQLTGVLRKWSTSITLNHPLLSFVTYFFLSFFLSFLVSLSPCLCCILSFITVSISMIEHRTPTSLQQERTTSYNRKLRHLTDTFILFE